MYNYSPSEVELLIEGDWVKIEDIMPWITTGDESITFDYSVEPSSSGLAMVQSGYPIFGGRNFTWEAKYPIESGIDPNKIHAYFSMARAIKMFNYVSRCYIVLTGRSFSFNSQEKWYILQYEINLLDAFYWKNTVSSIDTGDKIRVTDHKRAFPCTGFKKWRLSIFDCTLLDVTVKLQSIKTGDVMAFSTGMISQASGYNNVVIDNFDISEYAFELGFTNSFYARNPQENARQDLMQFVDRKTSFFDVPYGDWLMVVVINGAFSHYIIEFLDGVTFPVKK